MFSRDQKTFSHRLRWLRKDALNLSFQAFAEYVGVPKGYLNELESGKKNHPSADCLAKIAEKTGVSREWLENGQGEPHPPSHPPALKLNSALSVRPMNYETALKALLRGADGARLAAIAVEHLSQPLTLEKLELVQCILEELRLKLEHEKQAKIP